MSDQRKLYDRNIFEIDSPAEKANQKLRVLFTQIDKEMFSWFNPREKPQWIKDNLKEIKK